MAKYLAPFSLALAVIFLVILNGQKSSGTCFRISGSVDEKHPPEKADFILLFFLFMTTITAAFWDTTFPTLPGFILPTETPPFTDTQSLIDFVRANIRVIEDNWTYAIRQRGVQGRLRMMEDNENDEKFRSETLRRAIVSAQRKALNV